MFQGVKGSIVPAIERRISVSPSCQPAVIDVSYADSSGQTVYIGSNQEVVGVCGDTIRHISESFLHLHCSDTVGWSSNRKGIQPSKCLTPAFPKVLPRPILTWSISGKIDQLKKL